MLKLILSSFFALTLFIHVLFLAYWFTPGNSIEGYLFSSGGYEAPLSDADRHRIESEMGFSRSFRRSLVFFYQNLLNGSWGLSFSQNTSVSKIILDRTVRTLSYVLPSLLFLFFFSFVSVMVQVSSKSFLSKSLKLFFKILLCVPLFVFAVFWLRFFSNAPPNISLLLIAVFAALPTVNILMQEKVLCELEQPYFRAVQAKGVSFQRMYFIHLFKPCFWVFLSLLPWWWSLAMGCAIVSEPLFRVPGLGLLAFESFRNQDIPVLLGISLFWGAVRITLGLIRELFFQFTMNQRVIGSS